MTNANTPALKKWYVFDEHDCFDCKDSGRSAGVEAENLEFQGFNGVHIVCMTKAQFDHYTTHNDLGAALKIET